MNRVFKKVFPFMLAVLIAFSLAPATASFADEPGHTYFTVKFGNFEAINLKPIATGDSPYNGQVHVFDFLFGDKTYGLFINYKGGYDVVADHIFYDEGSNDLILDLEGDVQLKDFCVELHTGSTGTLKDDVRVAVNCTRYAFDDDGRVYFTKTPKDMILNVDLVGKAPTRSKKTVNKSKTYTGSCTVKVKNYYKRIVLNGNDPGIAKINKSLKKMSTKFLKDGNVHEYAKEQAKYGSYDDDYEDYCTQSVSFMNSEVVSIFEVRQWYAGGVSNVFFNGYVFDLRTGKQIKKLTKFTKETDLKKLRATILKKMVKQNELEELAAPEINKMKATDFNFAINKKGNVEVYFGPYKLGHGGWTTQCTVAGKYKK